MFSPHLFSFFSVFTSLFSFFQCFYFLFFCFSVFTFLSISPFFPFSVLSPTHFLLIQCFHLFLCFFSVFTSFFPSFFLCVFPRVPSRQTTRYAPQLDSVSRASYSRGSQINTTKQPSCTEESLFKPPLTCLNEGWPRKVVKLTAKLHVYKHPCL